MDNKATSKLDPHVQLSKQQAQLVNDIEKFINIHLPQNDHAVYVIYGEAGTGKSVVLSHLFNDLAQQTVEKTSPLYQTHNYFLVNHPEILKVYQQLALTEKHVFKKNFLRPTSFINQVPFSDVSIIDEAHLLLSQRDAYNKFRQDNQLTEIIKKSKVTILVFDPHQVLRTKSFWTTQMLQKVIKAYPHTEFRLTEQFRMNCSQQLVEWMDNFSDGKLTPIPDPGKNYDFKIFDDPEKMYQMIIKRNNEFGLSRMLATYCYPSTLDGHKHYVKEGDFKSPWNQYNYTSTPWAEIPDSIDQVGSMYTCQGFDLNYVGLIIGPVITLEPGSNKLEVHLDKFEDPVAYQYRKDLKKEDFDKIKKQLMLNSINVLMKRGTKGLYIYASDPNLRNSLLNIH